MMIDDDDNGDSVVVTEIRVLSHPEIRPEVTYLAPIYYDLHLLIVSYHIFKYQVYTEARFLHATLACVGYPKEVRVHVTHPDEAIQGLGQRFLISSKAQKSLRAMALALEQVCHETG
jgi:hypothetical protein